MKTEKKKISRPKKILIILLIIIAIYIVFTIPYRIVKANSLYGNEVCSLISNPPESSFSKGGFWGDKDHPTMGGTAITGWRCSVCGWYSRAATTATPELCELCAKITGRCETCGKLLK